MHFSPTKTRVVTNPPKSLLKIIFRVSAFFICLFLSLDTYAQTPVKGRVLDGNNNPVPGATIKVKGAQAGVAADDNGAFEINAPGTSTLVISSIGYIEQEVAVRNRKDIVISLVPATNSNQEVIVIGYGTQRKADVTGSTVSVKGETLNEIKAPNIFNQLQGRAAGVDIQNNSANIGSGGQIRIRGNRSISGNNNPLIVVDGMAYGGSINDIDPENIANVDILKDASATAIFGSRGSNGVIIITTKRGRVGQAITTYNGYAGLETPLAKYDLFNAAEYAQFKEDARQGQPGFLTNPNILSPYALTDIEKTNLAAGVDTDWQDLLLTKGMRTGHDISVNGGSDKTQYNFGVGYFRQTGIIHDQSLNRGSFHVNIDHKVTDWLKVGFQSFNTMTFENRLGTNAYGSGNRLGPIYKPYNDDGTINFLPAIQQGVDQQQINPLTAIGNNDLIKAFQRRLQIQDNFYGEVQLAKGLTFRSSFGFGWSQTFNSNYTGPGTIFNTNTNTAGARIFQGNSEGWQYTVNNSFNYNHTFAGKHKLQAQVLQEVQKNRFRSQGYDGTGVPANYIQDYNFQLADVVTANGGGYSESGLIGYMGRALYSYDDRYLLTATIRADASSVLAPGNQWTTYPAFSVGWNIANEKFMQNVQFLSTLKLRAGWGISSNAGINPYTTRGSLSTSFYNYGQGTTPLVNYVGGYTINTLPNPNLTWEKTSGLNLGIDYGLFNGRISGSIEYFSTQTDGILLTKSLPRSQGANSILVNTGKTTTNGFEFNISSVNVKARRAGDFNWRTDFNAFFTREKITELQQGLQRDEGNGWFVGYPITVIYDVKKLGIWQTKDAADATRYGAAPGDIRLEDVNNDGLINAADRQIIGTFQPDLVAGMTNSFQYKNFDLNIVLFGRFGQTIVATYLSADGGGSGYPFFLNSRVNQHKVDYWTPTNPTDAFPQPDASRDGLLYTSTLTYRDGSFIKIRTIDLGYNIAGGLLKNSRIQNLRLYVSAQNPFILWSPLVRDGLGIDPEGNGTGNAVSSQVGGAAPVQGRSITVNMGVPPSRQFIVGVNLKF